MLKNNTWNAVLFSIVITTVVASLIWSMALYSYSIYFRIIDIKNQVYITLESESIKNKQFIDYITDPINYNWDQFKDKDNLQINKFTRYSYLIEDNALPWKQWYFFMTDIDLESSKALSKIKQLAVYYKKPDETWDLFLNFIKYNKNYLNDFKWWKNILSGTGCTWWPYLDAKYDCKYIITDFSDTFKNNIFSYLMFFSSDSWISYAIEWLDLNKEKVEIPSRYLEQKFELKTNFSDINKKVDSKIDLYEKFNINLNMWLYNIK